MFILLQFFHDILAKDESDTTVFLHLRLYDRSSEEFLLQSGRLGRTRQYQKISETEHAKYVYSRA